MNRSPSSGGNASSSSSSSSATSSVPAAAAAAPSASSSPITTRFSPRLTSTSTNGMVAVPPLVSQLSPNASPSLVAGNSRSISPSLTAKQGNVSTLGNGNGNGNGATHGRKASESSPLLPKSSSSATSAAAAAEKKGKIMTIIYCVMLLISAVGNSIFFKKMINTLPNYPYFLSQLTTVAYIPLFGSMVIYQLLFTNLITSKMREFPKRKFFFMGAFDAVAGVFMLFGGVHTAGSTQALLNNAVIPVTMVLSVVVLGAKYSRTQYVGAATILAGVGIVMIPQFMGSASSRSTADNQPLFNMIFLCANIPMALSSVYKEVAFKNDDIDVNYLQAWVAIWQMVFGLLLMPLNTLEFLGANTLRWNELFDALVKGASCLAGVNSVLPPNCWTAPDRIAGLQACDTCDGAWLPVVLYMSFNCMFNIFIVLVIKHGGAALMYVVMTLRLPLVQFAFSMAIINNPPDTFGWASIAGLTVILAGLITYRYSALTKKPATADEEDVIQFTFGHGELAGVTRRRRTNLVVPRDVVRLRQDLARKLGVISTPVTPHSPRSRNTTPRLKTSHSNMDSSSSSRSQMSRDIP